MPYRVTGSSNAILVDGLASILRKLLSREPKHPVNPYISNPVYKHYFCGFHFTIVYNRIVLKKWNFFLSVCLVSTLRIVWINRIVFKQLKSALVVQFDFEASANVRTMPRLKGLDRNAWRMGRKHCSNEWNRSKTKRRKDIERVSWLEVQR